MKNYVLLLICGISTLVAKDFNNEPNRPARNIIVITIVASSQAAPDLEAASTAALTATNISTDINESESDGEVDDDATVVDDSEHPEIAPFSDEEDEL